MLPTKRILSYMTVLNNRFYILINDQVTDFPADEKDVENFGDYIELYTDLSLNNNILIEDIYITGFIYNRIHLDDGATITQYVIPQDMDNVYPYKQYYFDMSLNTGAQRNDRNNFMNIFKNKEYRNNFARENQNIPLTGINSGDKLFLNFKLKSFGSASGYAVLGSNPATLINSISNQIIDYSSQIYFSLKITGSII